MTTEDRIKELETLVETQENQLRQYRDIIANLRQKLLENGLQVDVLGNFVPIKNDNL